MNFQVSDKVVCVDDSNQKSPFMTNFQKITKGVVYTIESVTNDGRGVTLSGVWIEPNTTNAAFHSHRFRKVSDIKAGRRSKRREMSKP